MTRTLPRCSWLVACAAVLLASLAAPPAAAQSGEEHDVETIEAPAGPPPETEVEPAEAVDHIVRRTDGFRQQEGRETLERHEKLMAAAEGFARYMAEHDRYGHHADGRAAAARVADEGYEYCVVTENIAYAFDGGGYESRGLADQFFEGWRDSPGHRENMLGPNVTETGVAVARSEKTGYWYAVQLFGRPRSAAIEFRVANESDASVSYTIGEKRYELPPRYVRRHLRCRPSPLRFDLRGGEAADTTREAVDGARYNVTESGGELRVEGAGG
ncbi:CAP domain-containing protein [Pseudobythopirellula maris]|uniref:CAP domain-containing protein n=1 Tax=Pseudobythopirellula maris TaxID=2527991 RepID=UPI0011B5A479|nr:CAP domain-containing protein [Pseudobythopirellula maris]